MLRVTIEMLSARDGRREIIGRMDICNTGSGTLSKGNYKGRLYRRRSKTAVLKMGGVKNFPRRSYSVWKLVARMLLEMYPEEKKNDR